MTVAAFDTLKFARALRERGKFSAEEAEGFADALAEAFEGDIATKTDLGGTERKLDAQIRETERKLDAQIRETERKLDAQIRETELRLEAKIEAVKGELLKWMFGALGFQTFVILGAVVTLARA